MKKNFLNNSMIKKNLESRIKKGQKAIKFERETETDILVSFEIIWDMDQLAQYRLENQ